ncbi:MAG TPA: AAA family ATPase, partial [Saprospirales bacterium]|nr:AAA family ATPase [Saprospirales bacterium]
KFKFAGRNMQLFRKIMGTMETIPYPGDLKNLIKTSLAFSNSNDEYDYLTRLYKTITGQSGEIDLLTLQKSSFTVREIEILTGISKSQVARGLKEKSNYE